MLWRSQAKGGFEDALAEAQRRAVLNPGGATDLAALQSAVKAMFDDMNEGFFRIQSLNFKNTIEYSVLRFLANFDAIFTLNQDLLLEHHYISNDPSLLMPGKWSGVTLPGVVPYSQPIDARDQSWARCFFKPVPPEQFSLAKRMQPIFKLHGSSNWYTDIGASMMVIGGNKVREIGVTPILSWYQKQFESMLSEPGTRLMAVGYGFRDEHINQIIARAINYQGLKLFVIAPEGAELAKAANPTSTATIYARSDMEEAFERGLIGASRRGLREIFSGDEAEFAKLKRFFD